MVTNMKKKQSGAELCQAQFKLVQAVQALPSFASFLFMFVDIDNTTESIKSVVTFGTSRMERVVMKMAMVGTFLSLNYSTYYS